MGLFWLQNGREVLSSASQVGDIYEHILHVFCTLAFVRQMQWGMSTAHIVQWTLDRCNVHWAEDTRQWTMDTWQWAGA